MSKIIEENDTKFKSPFCNLHQAVAVMIVKIVQKIDAHDKPKNIFNLNRIILCRSF